jgi:outer membrane protein assembly factor BamA
LFSNTLDTYYARLNMRWNVLRKFSLSTPLFYEHATESRVDGETLQRYGAAVSVGRRITRKLSGSVGYQFFMNESDRPGRDYVQNRLVFDFAYSF